MKNQIKFEHENQKQQKVTINVSTRIFRGIIAVLAGKFGVLLLTFFFTPILVRLIGKPGYGIYGTVLGIYFIARSISNLGMFGSTRKHIAQYSFIKGSESEIASFSILVAGCMGLVCTFIGGLFVEFLNTSGKLESELSLYLMIMLAILIVSGILEVFISTLYGIYKEKNAAIIRVLQKVAFFAFAIFLIKIKFGLKGIFFGLVLGEILTTAYALFTVNKHVKVSFRAAIRGARNYGKQVLSFGVLTIFGLLSAELLAQSDIIIVRFFEGNTVTGAYKAARVATEMILFLTPALQLVMLTNCAELWQQKNRKELLSVGSRLWKYNFLFLSLLGIGFFVLAESFVKLYFGIKFADAVTPLRILIPGFFFLGLSRIINPVIVVSGWIFQTTVLSIFMAIINIVLNLLLVPRFGVAGAAIGTTGALGMLFLGHLVLLQLRGLNFVKEFPICRITILLVVFTGLFYYLCILWPFGETSKLLITPPVGAAIFAFMTLGLRIVSLREVGMQARQAMRIFART